MNHNTVYICTLNSANGGALSRRIKAFTIFSRIWIWRLKDPSVKYLFLTFENEINMSDNRFN